MAKNCRNFRRLACPDERFRDWAEKVDVDYGPIIEEEKKEKIYEIDALVSHLYGLKEDEITHIYETFHSTWTIKTTLKKSFNITNHINEFKNEK